MRTVCLICPTRNRRDTSDISRRIWLCPIQIPRFERRNTQSLSAEHVKRHPKLALNWSGPSGRTGWFSAICRAAGLSEDEGPWQSTEPTASSSSGRFRRSISAARPCRLMGLSRTTFYDQPSSAADDTAIVEAIAEFCEPDGREKRARVRFSLGERDGAGPSQPRPMAQSERSAAALAAPCPIVWGHSFG